MRAAEHAPRDPSRILERRYGLVEIVQCGVFVIVERLRVTPPHLERQSITFSENASENYLSAGAPFDYDAEDAERLEREQAPFRPFPPLWVRFLRVVGAALLVVLIQADWTQRKLRDYFLRPLARLTNRVSPRGYQTYDWEE